MFKSGTLSISLGGTTLPPPQGFSQIQMGIVVEAIIDSTIMQNHRCLPHLES